MLVEPSLEYIDCHACSDGFGPNRWWVIKTLCGWCGGYRRRRLWKTVMDVRCRGVIPKREFKLRGRPLDFAAADELGRHGARLDDVIDDPTSRRAIEGIVAYSPDDVSMTYSETGRWG